MYKCTSCGNMEEFYELNTIRTIVFVDPGTGDITDSHDTFVECAEVVCAKCKGSSEDGTVTDRKGGFLTRV